MRILSRKPAKQSRRSKPYQLCVSRTEAMQKNKSILNSLAGVLHYT